MLFQRPFVTDMSALVYIKNRRHLERLTPLVENTFIQWPPSITGEVHKYYQEDDLGRWVRRHPYGETELSAEERLLFDELTKGYGKPFRKEGRTRKLLSDADAEALAVAIIRGWILVTDDTSMQIICTQRGGIWISCADFLRQLGVEEAS